MTPELAPRLISELELAAPLPHLSDEAAEGQVYRVAQILIRLHSAPLGLLIADMPPGGLTPTMLSGLIWVRFAAEIEAHLQADNLPTPTELTPAGLTSFTSPPCHTTRWQAIGQPPPRVSVIIPTHERASELPACLDAVLVQSYPNYEVLIVDNAPRTPATQALIASQYAEQVRYIREDRQGLSFARNAGAAAATGEILVWTDDDVRVDVHWLWGIVSGFSAAENVACVGGLVLPAELETPAQHWFEQYGGFSKGLTRQIFDLNHHHPRRPLFPFAPGLVGTGASMAIRANIYTEIGMADTALGAGSPAGAGEDLDLYFQMLVRGYQIVYEPFSVAWHTHRRTLPQLERQMYFYGVGFVAHLIKVFWQQPRRILEFLAQLPQGLAALLSPKSFHNVGRQASYPARLTWIERWGMLVGPFLYLQSAWRARSLRRPQ